MTDDEQREEAKKLLEGGLKTDVFPRADSDQQMREILNEIRASDRSIEARLKIGGFTLEPVDHEGIEQACDNCMYYLVRRRYCELPELAIAVEPKWSCRVWRI